MKRYVLKREDGLYLNSDYHTRYKQGYWRSREKAQLYKSLRGVRSALPFTFTDAIEDHVNIPWHKVPGHKWTAEDHELRNKRFNAAAAIPLNKFYELIARDGYVVEEIEI